MTEAKPRPKHIKLTSHPHDRRDTIPVNWGAGSAAERGPVIGTISDTDRRNVIGAIRVRILSIARWQWPPAVSIRCMYPT